MLRVVVMKCTAHRLLVLLAVTALGSPATAQDRGLDGFWYTDDDALGPVRFSVMEGRFFTSTPVGEHNFTQQGVTNVVLEPIDTDHHVYRLGETGTLVQLDDDTLVYWGLDAQYGRLVTARRHGGYPDELMGSWTTVLDGVFTNEERHVDTLPALGDGSSAWNRAGTLWGSPFGYEVLIAQGGGTPPTRRHFASGPGETMLEWPDQLTAAVRGRNPAAQLDLSASGAAVVEAPNSASGTWRLMFDFRFEATAEFGADGALTVDSEEVPYSRFAGRWGLVSQEGQITRFQDRDNPGRTFVAWQVDPDRPEVAVWCVRGEGEGFSGKALAFRGGTVPDWLQGSYDVFWLLNDNQMTQTLTADQARWEMGGQSDERPVAYGATAAGDGWLVRSSHPAFVYRITDDIFYLHDLDTFNNQFWIRRGSERPAWLPAGAAPPL